MGIVLQNTQQANTFSAMRSDDVALPKLLLVPCSAGDVYRFAILPPLLGVLFSGLVAYFVVHTDSTIFLFLIGDFMYGCCGSTTAMSMSCYTYVADRTPPERRLLRITILQALSFTIIDCFASVGLRSNLMRIFVCASVCLSVHLHNLKTARPKFPILCMFPVAMAWSFSDGVAIRHVFPVLHISVVFSYQGPMGRSRK